jgi:uncharacterized membrane protein YqjE
MPGQRRDPEARAVDLLSDVATLIGRLIKGELMLARAEATEAARNAAGGALRLGVALVFGLVGLNVLAGAVVAGLASAGMAPAPAGLAVAVVLFGVSLLLALSARSLLRPKGLLPMRAMRGMAEDARALRAGLRKEGQHHV